MKKIESCDYIIIAGPTASGKSDLALELAKKINGSIINSDSIQIYKDLKILSARPNLSQRNQIKHYLYGFVDSNDSYSVGRWLTNVKETISDIKKQKQVPIFVGGTGLYLYILENGLSPIPDKVYRIFFYAYNLPTELSAHGDAIVFPDLYVPVLINRARYYMHQFKDNNQGAAFALEDYKRGLKTMKLHLMEPTPNYVKDDRIRFI